MVKPKGLIWQNYVVVGIAVLAVALFGGWYYRNQVYLQPQNVFWDTLDQNLQTGSITKTINKTLGDQSVLQTTNMQFKAQLASYSSVTIKDDTKGSSSTVVTETIGTPTQDYLKYTQITSENNPTPATGIGVWALNNAGDSQEVQIYTNELMSSPIMFGYLNYNQRAELIKLIKDNKVYDIDYSTVDTLTKYNGKKAYTYKATINVSAFVPVFKSYLKMLGQYQLAEQIAIPETASNLKLTLIVDPASRQIKQLIINDSAQGETYSNYDSNKHIELPKDVKLNISELQSLLLN